MIHFLLSPHVSRVIIFLFQVKRVVNDRLCHDSQRTEHATTAIRSSKLKTIVAARLYAQIVTTNAELIFNR